MSKQMPCLCEILQDVTCRQLLWIWCALECAERGDLPPCPKCRGKGRLGGHECDLCHGSGTAPEGYSDTIGGEVLMNVPLTAVQLAECRHALFARKLLRAIGEAADLQRERGADGQGVAFEIVVRRTPLGKEAGR